MSHECNISFSGLYYPPLVTSHKLLANSCAVLHNAYQTKHSYANPITSFGLPKLKVWTKTLGFAICCDIDMLTDYAGHLQNITLNGWQP